MLAVQNASESSSCLRTILYRPSTDKVIEVSPQSGLAGSIKTELEEKFNDLSVSRTGDQELVMETRYLDGIRRGVVVLYSDSSLHATERSEALVSIG